jgi:hypothetical protein
MSAGKSFVEKWRLAVQVVAIDPSTAFRKALRMWLSADRCRGRSFPPDLSC